MRTMGTFLYRFKDNTYENIYGLYSNDLSKEYLMLVFTQGDIFLLFF